MARSQRHVSFVFGGCVAFPRQCVRAALLFPVMNLLGKLPLFDVRLFNGETAKLHMLLVAFAVAGCRSIVDRRSRGLRVDTCQPRFGDAGVLDPGRSLFSDERRLRYRNLEGCNN